MEPDFLVIGHVVRDRTSNGYRLGGVAYCALTALRLGLTPAIVTSVAPDTDLGPIMRDIPVHIVPSSETTTFRNIYSKSGRRQVLEGVAGRITPSDIPEGWRRASLVLLSPLAGEVDYALATYFPGSTVAVSMQGWLRSWDARGHVTPRHWDGREALPHVAAAVVSPEDVVAPHLIDTWAEMTPVLIVTLAREGARLHSNGCWHNVEPFPGKEVDLTGAGDVFAAAYLVRYGETFNPLESARFASCAAGLSIESKGLDGAPTREMVERRLGGCHFIESTK